MNRSDSFDQIVSDWLHADVEHRVPEHLDAVLRRTRTERQRPAWSSLERWLPMQTTLRFAPVPRLAWLLVVLALILAFGAAALLVGSHARPAPLSGLARNGEVIYSGPDHHLYVLDPVTDLSKALTTGASADHYPWLSPDGTRFFFLRESTVTDPVVGNPEPIFMVANVDGSDVRAISGPMTNTATADWTRDGARVLVASDVDGKPSITILTLDGSARPSVVDTAGMTATFVALRPDGREITFMGSKDSVAGVYAIGTDGRGLRTILPPNQGVDGPALSPDGTKIAYHQWITHGTIHVIDVNTLQDSVPAFDPAATDATFDEMPSWSPDGARLLFQRYSSAGGYRLATAPVTEGPVTETGPVMLENTNGADAAFSPDGAKIIAYYNADKSSWILDVNGGPGTKLPSNVAETATWQRTAP